MILLVRHPKSVWKTLFYNVYSYIGDDETRIVDLVAYITI